MSENLEIIRDVYDAFARGDVPAVVARLSPDIVWNEAENFPYADRNPYVGPDAVVEGLFARLIGEWDGWSLAVEELLDAGDVIIARGRYSGTHETTGTSIDAQFAHFWWLEDGVATRFQQYADTAQVSAAVAG